MSTTPETTSYHSSRKFSILLPLRAIQNLSFHYETPCTNSYRPEDDCQSSFFFRSTTTLSWKTSFSSCQQMIFCEKFWTIEWLILDDWVSYFWWLELMDVFGKISGHLYRLIHFDCREINYFVNSNLFVTSKNENTNPPIHELKCCLKPREPFKSPR